MSARKKQSTSTKHPDLWGFGKVFIVCLLLFFAIKGGFDLRRKEANPPTIREMSMSAIHAAQKADTSIPLKKGVPVGTLRLNGETYVIYTTE